MSTASLAVPFFVSALALAVSEAFTVLAAHLFRFRLREWLSIVITVKHKDREVTAAVADQKIRGINEENLVQEFSRMADVVCFAAGFFVLVYAGISIHFTNEDISWVLFAWLAVGVIAFVFSIVSALLPITTYRKLTWGILPVLVVVVFALNVGAGLVVLLLPAKAIALGG